VIALIADIVRYRDRTWHAVILVLSVGFTTALILASVVVVATFAGTSGAAVAGSLAAAGVTARQGGRWVKRRAVAVRDRPRPEESAGQ
jgi:hypothetical protein